MDIAATDIDTQVLIWTVVVAVLAGLTLVATIWLGRRNEKLGKKAVSEAELSNQIATERSIVEWHVDRASKDDAGVFRITNQGQDTAHKVTVEAWDSHNLVKETIDTVSPSEPGKTPHYIEFKLDHRSEHGPEVDAARELVPEPTPRPPGIPTPDDILARFQEMLDTEINRQVQVQITWSSALGRWSHKTIFTG